MSKKYGFFPFDSKYLVLIRDSKVIIKYGGHLCGYVALNKKKLPKEWHTGNYEADGLQYLNIHGGITWAREVEKHVVFGLDCGHDGDEERDELKNPEYVMDLVDIMEQQIMDYAGIIKKWRKARRKKQQKMLDKIRNKCPVSQEPGMGMMLGILRGGEGDFNE